MSTVSDFEKIEITISHENGKGEKYVIDNQEKKYDSFSDILKMERRKRKISQLELAKLCGFASSTYISKIELGKTNPSEKIMKKIAGILGFRLTYSASPKE